MGAKALGVVLAVFQVFAGGTKLFFHKEKIQQVGIMCQNFIIPYLYEAQHVSGDTPPVQF